MRMRFCATTRSPAPSSTASTLPVMLRRVASGLMMEKVRSSAMVLLSGFVCARLYDGPGPGPGAGRNRGPRPTLPAGGKSEECERWTTGQATASWAA